VEDIDMEITQGSNFSSAENHRDRSGESRIPQELDHNPDYPPTCYYCNEYFVGISKKGYEKHVLSRHPKMPCYPGLPDIEKHSLVANGMWWEI